ncbi:MAG TPA: SDR family NAD(P)-dependent oxidoreductase [Polyangiaceae bacterium]
MTKKATAVVTGGTSGLGEAAALALAAQGFRVLVVGRDEARGAEVVARAKAAGGEVELVRGDMFTKAGVRSLAQAIAARAPSIDLLVNNAGGTFGKKTLTADGFELTFALNVMAPFVLTDALLPQLAAAKGRVVNLVTNIPKGAKTTLEDLTGERADAGIGSYTRNKLALLALTKEQQRHYATQGVTVVSLHPGIIPGTRFGQDMPAFLRSFGGFVARLFGIASSLDDAAQRYVLVGTGQVDGGAFYKEGKLAPPPALADDPAFAAQLWTHLEGLAG